jgi:hypothetical protein
MSVTGVVLALFALVGVAVMVYERDTHPRSPPGTGPPAPARRARPPARPTASATEPAGIESV